MGIVIALAVAIVLSAAVFLVGCGKTGAPTGQPPAPVVQATSPEHEALRLRLRKLAASEPPRELSIGAMCYEVAGTPGRFDYVCPTCHAKTLVASDARSSQTPSEIEACRRLAKEIQGLDVTFVEAGFCDFCFPDAKERSLDLVVHHADGLSHRVQGITSDDLTLIAEFLAGKEKHVGERGSETPLKDHISRLQELLVLPKDTK